MDEKIHSNTLYNSSNVLSQVIQAPEFTSTVKLTLTAENIGDRAGLAIMGYNYSYISLGKEESGYVVSQTIGLVNDGKVEEHIVYSKVLVGNTVYFRVKVEYGMKCSFSYSVDGEEFKELGSSFKGSEGHWVGGKIGIFNLNLTKEKSKGYADFHFIRFKKENHL